LDMGRVEMETKDALLKYQEFFNAAYAEGTIDRKTKHLIALGASLAAGCDPWARYCLAVARELGATDEELQETMAISMTVGATKIKVLQENALASLPGKKPEETKAGNEEKSGQESCFTWSSTWCFGGASHREKFLGYQSFGSLKGMRGNSFFGKAQ
jgi:AhpD family alkylhydroperoxidase